MENNLHPLADFEDTIRMNALPIEEALQIQQSLMPTEVFVVGGGLQKYVDPLRAVGFRDLWKIQLEPTVQQLKIQHLQREGKSDRKAKTKSLMYAYIDYVLVRTRSHLMIFLDQKNWVTHESLISPTQFEVFRALTYFSEFYRRIYFVTGLFDLSVEQLSQNLKVQTRPI